MKIGLVLEGGGMRGLYTAGVLDLFMEWGFRADTICGTSAGATFGINLPSKQKGRVLRYNTLFAGDPRYISWRSLLLTGNIVNTHFAYFRLPQELDPFDYKTYYATGTDFFVCVTNIKSGMAEYIKLTDLHAQMDVIRASASLPFLSRSVKIGGVPYLDGGIVDNIPLDKCKQEGCDKIIVILTHPRGFVRRENLTLLGKLFYPGYKNLIEAFKVRNERYNRRVSQIFDEERDGRLIVIAPSEPVVIGRLEQNVEKMKAVHSLGYRDAQAKWEEIASYLSKK